MHLTILEAIGHVYHIRMALVKVNRRTVYISNAFHQDIVHLNTFCARMKTRLTNFVEIVQRLPTDLVYTNASGLRGEEYGYTLTTTDPTLYGTWSDLQISRRTSSALTTQQEVYQIKIWN